MTNKKKVKLSSTQIWIIERIKKDGKVYFSNNQNPTARKLILLGICEWDGSFENLILTEKHKDINI